MRITDIGLYANDIEVTTLSFRDPYSRKPYIAKATLGLDAEEIIPKYYGSGNASRQRFHLPTINDREVVFRIALNPKFNIWETYSGLRDNLYRAIAMSRNGLLELRFMYGPGIIATLEGFITKFEAPLNTPDPEVQLTIMCEEGMLTGVAPVKMKTASLGLTDLVIADNDSTAPHGMSIEVQFTSPTSYFTIEDDGVIPDWSFKVLPDVIGGSSGFQANDRLFMINERREKSIFVLRSATQYFLADKIVYGSIWPIIFSGTNRYKIDVGAGSYQWNGLSYYTTYWGV